ncbi:hypothetical protein EYR36_010522 [Pleurotus pulmonarius]|nr:hypothetical protein EYR36_010522 [Pleurotus pulmonarius]
MNYGISFISIILALAAFAQAAPSPAPATTMADLQARGCSCHKRHNFSMDKVFVDTLQLAAQVGTDCWGRPRPQQISLSIYLHLSPLFLERAGISDDVEHSVHYGHLTKSITQLVQADGAVFNSIDDLIDRVAVQAFELAAGSAVEVRVVVDLPKLILLASGFEVDVTLPSRRKTVSVKDLVLFVIIGVNAPEREAKQRVIVNISFVEKVGAGWVDYAQIVDTIQKVRYLSLRFEII